MNATMTAIPENPSILALDLEGAAARFVCAVTDGHCARVNQHGCFPSIAALERHLDQWPNSEVYLAGDAPDPLGFVPWLMHRGYAVEQFPIASRLSFLVHRLVPHGLPESHHDAFLLATLAAIRKNVPEAAEDILFGLFHINDELEFLQDQIRLLVATVTARELGGQIAPNVDYCPF